MLGFLNQTQAKSKGDNATHRLRDRTFVNPRHSRILKQLIRN